MRKPLRYMTVASICVAFPVTLAACGGSGDDGLPSDAVVKIGSGTIKKTAFNQWMSATAKARAQQAGGTGAVVVPDPPNFTRCVAQKKKMAVKPAAGKP